jgi:hypothetical protein
LPAATPCESPASNDKGECSRKHPAENQEQFFDQPKYESEYHPDKPDHQSEKQQGYHQQRQQIYKKQQFKHKNTLRKDSFTM